MRTDSQRFRQVSESGNSSLVDSSVNSQPPPRDENRKAASHFWPPINFTNFPNSRKKEAQNETRKRVVPMLDFSTGNFVPALSSPAKCENKNVPQRNFSAKPVSLVPKQETPMDCDNGSRLADVPLLNFRFATIDEDEQTCNFDCSPSTGTATPIDIHSSASRQIVNPYGSTFSLQTHSLSAGMYMNPCPTDRSDFSCMNDPPLSADYKTPRPPESKPRDRRGAVSSAPVKPEDLKDWKLVVYLKTEQERKFLNDIISTKLSVLFGGISKENKEKIVSTMRKLQVSKGMVLIKQGDVEADNFYIVGEGGFDIFVKRLDGTEDKVLESGPGMFFGEVALMYNSPRSGTCIAAQDSIVWSLDRVSFRMLLVTEENTKKKCYETLLDNIEIFQYLTSYERSRLSDLLTVQKCTMGECVIQQGDQGERFYIVEKGEFICTLKADSGSEVLVQRYFPGGYFGELALITENGKRNASIYTVADDSVLLWIDKSTFDRVLGPIHGLLQRQATLYPTTDSILG